MTTSAPALHQTIKSYIVDQFLRGEPLETLSDETTLISSGILDSIRIVKLVAFLEERYGIELEAEEMSPRYLDKLTAIVSLVTSKLTQGKG